MGMSKSEAGMLGALKTIELNKQRMLLRIEEYNKQPNICKNCGKPLPYERRNNKFCNSSCSASYNNKKREITYRKNIEYATCLNCGKTIEVKRNCEGKYCDNKCQQEYIYKKYIEKWQKGEVDGMSGKYGISQHVKHYMLEKVGNKCEQCGWNQINPYTNKVPLEIHHIDGNYKNNKEENLQVLCPNCHSLTSTYKAKNKEGRKERKKYSL